MRLPSFSVSRFILSALVMGCLVAFPFLSSGCFEDPKAAEQGKKDIGADKLQVDKGDDSGGDSGGDSSESDTSAAPTSEMANLPFQEVTIPSTDGLELYGKLYDPSQKPESDESTPSSPSASAGDESEAPVTKYPLVILLHMLNGTQADWGVFPARLVKQGYAVFAMDLRGHGKSTKTRRGLKSWRNFSGDDWQKLAIDVEKVLEFFKTSEDYPQTNTKNVALVGASLGANVALMTASRNNSIVKAIVLISPGLEYKGLTASQDILYYTNAMFLTASQLDPYPFQSTEMLYKWGQGPKSIRLYRNIGHGTDMLKREPKLMDEITRWLNVQMLHREECTEVKAEKTSEEPAEQKSN